MARREEGLWWGGLCPPGAWGAGSVVAGRVSGTQARARGGKERNFASAAPGTWGKKAEGQYGVFDVSMCSASLYNFCSSKAEGHLRFRLALDLGQYRNCLIFPQSIGGYINQTGFCLRGCISLQAPACAAEILSLVWKLREWQLLRNSWRLGLTPQLVRWRLLRSHAVISSFLMNNRVLVSLCEAGRVLWEEEQL